MHSTGSFLQATHVVCFLQPVCNLNNSYRIVVLYFFVTLYTKCSELGFEFTAQPFPFGHLEVMHQNSKNESYIYSSLTAYQN